MRVLHTADWHMGLVTWGKDRSAEINDVLEELAEIANAEDVDLILIAGDILNDRETRVEVLKDMLHHLRKLSNIAPVVAVLGNHDSEVLSTYDGLIENVRIVGSDFMRYIKGDWLIVETNSGKVTVCPVPYLYGKKRLLDEMGEGREKEKFRKLLEYITSDRCAPPTDHKILLIHSSVEGFIPPDVTGFLVEKSMLREYVTYGAFGHVHKYGVIKNTPPMVYSGSVIQVNFNEEGERKGVVIFDSNDRTWKFVELKRYKRLGTVDLSNSRNFADIRSGIEEGLHRYDYLRVRINPILDYKIKDILAIEGVVKVEVKSEEFHHEVLRRMEENKSKTFEDYLMEYLDAKKIDSEMKRKILEVISRALESKTA